jgi:hypothetical protein
MEGFLNSDQIGVESGPDGYIVSSRPLGDFSG